MDTPTLTPEVNENPASRRRLLPTQAELNMLTTLANGLTGCGVDGTRTPALTFAKLLTGWEHGLPPSTSLNEIRLSTDGRLTVPELVHVAAIRSGGLADIRTVAVNSDHAIVEVTRRDWEPNRKETVKYTVDDAVAAGLISFDANGKETTKKDNWKRNRPAMLLARARGEAKRRWIEEAAAGLSYSPDELGDGTDDDGRSVEPVKLADPPPAPWAKPPALDASSPASPSAVPAPCPTSIPESLPPAPSASAVAERSDAGVPENTPVAPTAPPAVPTEGRATIAQQEQAMTLIKTLSLQADWKPFMARNGVQSFKDLSHDQASNVLLFLRALNIIDQCRKMADSKGPSDADWAKALQRRGVTKAIELKPEDAFIIRDKLLEAVTPSERARLMGDSHAPESGSILGKALPPSPVVAAAA